MNTIKKILIAEFHQETNVLNNEIWTEQRFRNDMYATGNDVLKKYHATRSTIRGITQTCEEHGYGLVPVCAMHATCGGLVAQEVVEQFLHYVLSALRTETDVAGIFLALHGATQSVKTEDVCGYILETIRGEVGPELVISVACDLHGNITRKCAENADVICAFHTYPHIDQFETGCRAAKLGIRLLESTVPLHLARCYLPMIVPAAGYSTEWGRFGEIMSEACNAAEKEEILDFSIFQMQPWLDVHEAGSAVLCFAENRERAEDFCRRISKKLYDARDSFWPETSGFDETIKLAQKTPVGKPVLLVDIGDSPGAGAPGDSAFVLLELSKRSFPVKTAFAVKDKDAVDHAFFVGEGGTAVFTIGVAGENTSVQVTATVSRLYADGHFIQEGPVDTGLERNLGRAARLRIAENDVLVCDTLSGTSDLQMYRHFGIEPTAYQLVVVKASMSYRSAYEKIASSVCLVNTVGASTSDLQNVKYHNLPRVFYPFVDSPLGGAPNVELIKKQLFGKMKGDR